MPANPEQIHAAFQEIGLGLNGHVESEAAARREALQLLEACAAQPAAFRTAAETAAASGSALRCALPMIEDISAAYSCGGQLPPHTVVAVDGSQAVPDRHAEVLFGIVNVGVVSMDMGSGTAPAIDVDTTLLFGDDLYPGDGALLSEGEIALRRDAAERASLLRHAPPVSAVAIAMLDGPLELWGPKELSDGRAFASALAQYLENLPRVAAPGLDRFGLRGQARRRPRHQAIRDLEAWARRCRTAPTRPFVALGFRSLALRTVAGAAAEIGGLGHAVNLQGQIHRQPGTPLLLSQRGQRGLPCDCARGDSWLGCRRPAQSRPAPSGPARAV